MKIIKSPMFNEAQYLNINAARVFWASLKSGHIIGAFVFLLCATVALTLGVHAAMVHAILYVFAFDGKVSGRMQGNVLMRNGRGRAFTVPALVRNSYTISARALLAQYSSGYAALTAAEQLAWSTFTMGVSNRMGASTTIKGKTCYVRLNVNLTIAGQPAITSPPVLSGVASPITSASATATAATSVISLTFAPTPTNANTWHLVFATKPLGTQILKPGQSAYRFIGLINNGAASPQPLTAPYGNKYGALTGLAGKRIFFSLSAVNGTTGQSVPAVGFNTIIV